MKYDVTITGLGSMAMEFLSPAMEMQFVILFNEDAPPELADMAIQHTA
ncbi:MAG: PTS sorbitol transporter subunit IIA, partial [Mogibacterium sp.]|nr:PTS sorbitol transporter subunit IIA [Mogibacterium sp.]